ncbi:hypothetical protein ISN45_Aa07g021070 [Arabidopsis thaliana x Arabidopsis arenosa]|uniref:Uncharacterized protein n=2 Tax=Arabidopsis TaxID=3701 RepID=A0A8T2AEF8_ARASU|nr:hypothetical protein ISN45_Aa07g021070 [Arabidopsis thaliana x Arabidopsis arenosa]KAG7571845.1 hypothetical protein ISN44_As09g002530 [Arabidopsis suecica]
MNSQFSLSLSSVLKSTRSLSSPSTPPPSSRTTMVDIWWHSRVGNTQRGDGVSERTPSCKGRGGSVDCSLGIQLAFFGTDKHLAVLNSWYEVENLKQYSLYGLYSNLKSSLTNQFNNFF